MNSFRETYFKFKLLGKRIYKHSSLTRPHKVIVKKITYLQHFLLTVTYYRIVDIPMITKKLLRGEWI